MKYQYVDSIGLKLRIGTNPWSHHVLAEAISESDPDYSESNKYRNYWGYEIEMLKNMAKILNFTYLIENPPDGKWGHIEPDGRWNGLVYHVSKDSVDLVICDIFIVYGRQQVRVLKNHYKVLFLKGFPRGKSLLKLWVITFLFRLTATLNICQNHRSTSHTMRAHAQEI